MRILLFQLFIQTVLLAGSLQGQETWRYKTDSVTSLIQRYYNAREIGSLYALAGSKFRQAIPQKQFEEITQSLHAQFGTLGFYTFDSREGNVVKYKAGFKMPMALYVSLDDSSKLETFFIGQWEEDTASRKGAALSNNPLRTPIDKKVDSLIKPFIAKANTVGLVIGVVKNKSMQVYGYGETKRGNGKIPDGNTLFEIGSITKTFTATLLADAVVKRKVSLNDPVSKYLPDSIPPLQFNGVPVTVQTLSNHSSGFPRMPVDIFLNADPENPYKHYDDKRLFNFLRRFKPIREPGKQYEYSNLAVGTLGVILERISGQSYEQLLQQSICKPLGMKNTRVSLLESDSVKFATGHNQRGMPTSSWEFKSLAAAGGIRSSVNDMLLFARAQVSNDNQQLQEAVALTHQQTFEYGQNRVSLGWHTVIRGIKTYYVHNGQTGGYRSLMVFNPNTDVAIVILTNGSVDTGEISFSLISWLEQN